ncbi:MAG: hypothetical protein MJ245_07435 [Clostridia bacterium]|nr:hypothetical protein [Clostridia bacterium]
MKKYVSIFLLLILSLSLFVACNYDTTNSNSSSNASDDGKIKEGLYYDSQFGTESKINIEKAEDSKSYKFTINLYDNDGLFYKTERSIALSDIMYSDNATENARTEYEDNNASVRISWYSNFNDVSVEVNTKTKQEFFSLSCDDLSNTD